ncbi:hypothetical protein L2E82_05714 [Cichorium intybus]|uniref:Uncharacterized protein n=1 Tax=Cichorium intybus TaxID=13427 RepID=A0ACB9H958_CICIN|nr:hypothetical protein L2E82_05714 [Cichorium intybus]
METKNDEPSLARSKVAYYEEKFYCVIAQVTIQAVVLIITMFNFGLGKIVAMLRRNVLVLDEIFAVLGTFSTVALYEVAAHYFGIVWVDALMISEALHVVLLKYMFRMATNKTVIEVDDQPDVADQNDVADQIDVEEGEVPKKGKRKGT